MKQDVRSRSVPGMARTSLRRSRTCSSPASARARPMWPWAARAANEARAGSTPSRRTSASVTSRVVGVRSRTCRVRDTIVGSTSSGVGAHRIHTVRGLGSSSDLSRALPETSLSRSASSTISTFQRPMIGVIDARRISSRDSSAVICSFSGVNWSTSACPRPRTWWQVSQVPHPPSGHCRAAAKTRAAVERPEPGGPVSSQAWVIEGPGSPRRMRAASAEAWARVATSSGCPMTTSQSSLGCGARGPHRPAASRSQTSRAGSRPESGVEGRGWPSRTAASTRRHLVLGAVRLQHQVALRRRGRPAQEGGADLGVERLRLGLHPVGVPGSAEADSGGDVEQDRQVRDAGPPWPTGSTRRSGPRPGPGPPPGRPPTSRGSGR